VVIVCTRVTFLQLLDSVIHTESHRLTFCDYHLLLYIRPPLRPTSHLVSRHLNSPVIIIDSREGRAATTAEKLSGTKVWVPTPGRLRPARPKAELGVGCGRGSPPPAVRVRGYHTRKFFGKLRC